MVIDVRLKAHQNRTKIVEKEKELVRQQGIKDPTLKLLRRKIISVTKSVSILEPIVQPKLHQIDPKDRGKKKVVLKSKKELAKDAQLKVDKELAKDLHAEQLKANKKVHLKKKSSEIFPKETNTWHYEKL